MDQLGLLRMQPATYRNDAVVGGLVLALLIGAALAPVLLVRIPAMVDYPNHLARMYLLSVSDGAAANPYYRVEWALYPNLAMDIVIPQIARLAGVEVAARIFLFLTQLLIVGGAMAIEWVIKRRLQLSGFAAVMFLYCLPFAWGFLNFEMALGVALVGIAVMLAIEDRPWPLRLAANTLCVAVLFASHFFALGIYGVVLGLHELWRAWQRAAPIGEIALRLLILAIPAVIVLAVMASTGGTVGNPAMPWLWHLGFKPLWLFSILNGYCLPVSWVSVVVLVGWLTLAAKRGVLRFAPAGLWMTLGLTLLYVAVPAQLFNASFVDQRVIVAAALILPAFVSLSLPNRRWLLASLACISAVTLANLAVTYMVWLSYRADYATMIASFGKLDKGALVLTAHSGEGEDPPMHALTEYPIYHAPTLAVHYASAFVPDLFTGAGKQPLRAQAAVLRLDIPEGGPYPLADLAAIAKGAPPPGTQKYVRSWHRDFDYLYVLGPHRENPLPALLKEVDRGRRFILYRILRTPPR
jgi:hypothetical protein